MTASSQSSHMQSGYSVSNMVSFIIPFSPEVQTSYPGTVVVVGHTECGGAAACYQASQAQQDVTVAAFPPTAPINRWLAPMLALTRSLPLSDVPAAEALNLVVEKNVVAQVDNLCNSEPITRAWSAGKQLSVHGWVYQLGNGILKDLDVSRGPPT
jgi:carbonic anhydrase